MLPMLMAHGAAGAELHWLDLTPERKTQVRGSVFPIVEQRGRSWPVTSEQPGPWREQTSEQKGLLLSKPAAESFGVHGQGWHLVRRLVAFRRQGGGVAPATWWQADHKGFDLAPKADPSVLRTGDLLVLCRYLEGQPSAEGVVEVHWANHPDVTPYQVQSDGCVRISIEVPGPALATTWRIDTKKRAIYFVSVRWDTAHPELPGDHLDQAH